MTHLNGKPKSYRPEIDGMRAVAVISVMIYHLKLQLGGGVLLAGGFLGVDLFFVLSGFLITQILVDEFSKTGQISILQFYWRRAKRILPPLLLVMVCSLPVAWFMLLPSELERFAYSILSALFFVSNAFWFFELSEYGAQSGLLQPFLHTWSLAIEEQFYLVFPPLLIVMLRCWSQRIALFILMGCLVLSLLAAQWLTQEHSALSFYAPTSRAWEMLAGSVLAFLSRSAPNALRGGLLDKIIPSLSLAVLLGCIVMLDLVSIQHPGFVTIPVILATSGLIWFMAPGEPVTRALSAKPVVYVGKLSYSLYLWHFPIFAFGRLREIGTPGFVDMASWVALTFALSITGYYLIEKPFRFRLSVKPFAGIVTMTLVPLCLLCALIISGTIAPTGKLKNLAALYGENEIDNTVLAQASWGPLDALSPDEDIGSWNALRASETEKTALWFTGENTRKVLIIGDSHSKDLFNALSLNSDQFPNTEFARFNLHRKSLQADLELLRAAPNFAASDTILIAPRYYREYRTALATMLSALKGQGKTLIVAGSTAEFDVGGAQPLFDWYLRQSGDAAALSKLNTLAPKFEDPVARARNADIQEIAEAAGAGFLSRRSLICDDSPKACTIVTPDRLKAMYDDTHWTLAGAKLFGQRAAKAGWLTSAP
ncbi:hypothetical protein NBRC116601_33410 [Cognatishimia sp. WU-CL00825]|uniref:acyltransferase family protein n=1 Tax=Cognatishimia sp. WU-CL00825 TaxID=3127658 RepID=UPI0031095F90